jgi:hypothetical protein
MSAALQLVAISCIVGCNVMPRKEAGSALALTPMKDRNDTMIKDEIMGLDKMQA